MLGPVSTYAGLCRIGTLPTATELTRFLTLSFTSLLWRRSSVGGDEARNGAENGPERCPEACYKASFLNGLMCAPQRILTTA